MAEQAKHGCEIRSTRRLASGDVEVTAVTPRLHLLVVVVPFDRSSAEDIDKAISLAMPGHLEVVGE